MRQSFSAFVYKAFGLALALCVFALPSAQAAGLGKLKVLSALGHPLRAEIELTAVAKDEAESIVVKLASHDAFRQANLEYTSALSTLNFAVEKRGERHIVKVTSSQALNEPFVGMLLELKSNSGRITREYTFLLDPADLKHITPAVVASAPTSVPVQPVVAAKVDKPAAAMPQPAAPAAKAKEEPKTAVATKEADKAPVKAEAKKEAAKQAQHKIKRGETLGAIATKYKYEDVTLEQMLVSIYQSNPNAFIGKNMNRLRVGRVLTVPDEQSTGSVTNAEAKKVIIAHTSNYSAYRNRLAEQAAKSAATETGAAGQAAGGKITAQVQEKTSGAKPAQDKLKLSKATPKSAGKSSGVSAEDQAAAAKAAADERARVKELEKNVGDLQRLLELKNQELAAQQKHAVGVAVAKEAADKAAADKVAADKAAADKMAALKAATDKAAVDKAAADKAAQKGSAPSASQPVTKPIKRVAPQPVPQEKSFFDEMLDSASDNLLYVGGGAAAILLLLLLLVRQRSKKNSVTSVGGSLVGESREAPNSMFGTSGGQSVDTSNSIFNTGFTPSASLLDANEVDPVAEADVYIAYGREAQAIEILKEALRAHPERNALRVKLLEIYAAQKDIQAFDVLAGELYALTRGEGEEWIYAAGLGVAIDPTNPLYAGGDISEELLNRPTSLQGSMTQPRQESEPDTLLKSDKQPEHLGYEFVQPSREQIEKPDLPLDLGAPSVSAAESEPPKAAPTPMEFNLEGSLAPKSQPPAPAPEPLGFDLGDLNVKKDEAPSTSGISVTETSTLDFAGMDSAASANQSADEDPALKAQLAAADRELSAIDKVEPYSPTTVDTMNTSQTQTAKSAGEFDFASINLDLDSANKPESASAPVDSAEMDTKIELAAAYLSIGDKEGARELLDEVIQDGTPEQIKRAQESLSKIS